MVSEHKDPQKRLSALDKVRLAVDFAYLDEQDARQLSFATYCGTIAVEE